MGRKLGALPPFWERGAGYPSNTVTWAEAYLHLASRYGQKLGAVPLWGRGAGSPSNTMWPGPRPTCKRSFILIRPTVWPQYTNVTDRTDRQWSDSTGRTILQTVTQRLNLMHTHIFRHYISLVCDKQVTAQLLRSCQSQVTAVIAAVFLEMVPLPVRY